MWKEWLKWILSTAGPKIFFVIVLTRAFGLRCGEALALKREDINLEAIIPKLIITGDSKGAKKSLGGVYIRKQHINIMKKWLREGTTSTRRNNHKHGMGKRRMISITETRRPKDWLHVPFQYKGH